MLKIISLIYLLLLFSVTAFSQGPDPSRNFNKITITRSGGSSGSSVIFNWKVVTDYTELNGRAGPMWSFVNDINPESCQYGKSLEINDHTGNTSFGGSDPRGPGTINGVFYDQLWYYGAIEIKGSKIIPYTYRYSGKKQRYLQFPVRLSFLVQAFPSYNAYRNGPPILNLNQIVDAVAFVKISDYPQPGYCRNSEPCRLCAIQSVTYSWDNTQTLSSKQPADMSDILFSGTEKSYLQNPANNF